MANREKALAKNTLILSIGTFQSKLTTFITLPILTGCLTTAEYGTYDLITTLVSLFLPAVTLQIQAGAFRFLIDRRDNKEETDKIVTNIFAFIITISVVALLVLFFVLSGISSSTKWLICIYFFVDILVLATQQIIRGFSKNKLYSASSVLQSVINMVLLAFVVYAGNQGLDGVLISITLATLAGLALLVIRGKLLSHIHLSLISGSVIKELLAYSWPLVPNSLSNWVLNFSDRAVLTMFLGVEANAVYAVAYKIPSLLYSVQGTFTFAWQENASLASSDDDVIDYYSHMFDEIFCILTGVLAILIAATPILFWILVRSDYSGSYNQMPILFMGMFFSCLSGFMGGIYTAHKKTKSIGITTVVAACINLAIDLLLVNIIGMYAASISTLIAYLFLAIERMAGVQKFQKVNYTYKKIFVYIIILIFMCVMCWINSLISNILNILVGVIFAIAGNKQLVISILNRLKSRLNNK